jgi:hypothetical protein
MASSSVIAETVHRIAIQRFVVTLNGSNSASMGSSGRSPRFWARRRPSAGVCLSDKSSRNDRSPRPFSVRAA